MPGESQQLPSSEPDPTVRVMETLRSEITHLRELLEVKIQATDQMCDAKFLAVEGRLALGESSRIEQKTDTQKAVEAALTAQKEAVKEQTASSDKAINKSEEGTARTIAQMSATFGAALAGSEGSISDLKERVGKIENVKVGGTEAKAAMYAFAGFLVSLILIGGFVAAAWPR